MNVLDKYSLRELSNLYNEIENFLKKPTFYPQIVIEMCSWAKMQISEEMIRRYDIDKGVTNVKSTG